MLRKVKRKNNIKVPIIGLILLFINSCVTYEKYKYVGIFKSSENSMYITLTDSEFVVSDSTKINNVNNRPCKIVSFGSWEIDEKKLLIFNSDYQPLDNYYIDFDVGFKDIESDSIHFKIEMPIQSTEKEFFSYKLDIDYEGEYGFNKQFSKPFQSNTLSVKTPPFGIKVKSITVTIIYEKPFSNLIEPYLGITTVSTIEKEVSSHNYYTLYVPIDLCYFEYERYNGDYLKIINKDMLIWNGVKYIRIKDNVAMYQN